jgi:serine/threonine protein kinase
MTIQLANNGNTHAKDVRLTFSDEFETKWNKPVTIPAGATTSLDIGIRPKLKGRIPLEVTAMYLDGMTEENRETYEFWIDVVEKVMTVTPVPAFSPAGPFTPPSLTHTQLLPDLSERYTELEFIGEGGFAHVFKAKRKDGQFVAVKIPISLDESTGKSFIAELQNWTRLNHPNIVKVYNFNIMPSPYFEMELCDSSLAEKKKPIESETAAWILFNVCEGLKFTHAQKIIHRDLKPQNILLKNGIPKISDWGLSHVITGSTLTTSAIPYTTNYAAPEQIDRKAKDERTDIWQLGVIFYELMTGELPFTGDTVSEILAGIITKNPQSPSSIYPSSHDVESIIMKCLEKSPSDRYQSVIELQKALALYLGITYKESLKKSLTANDPQRSAFYCGELVKMSISVGDMKSTYDYLIDLVHYSKGDVKVEALELSKQIKMRMDMGVAEIPDELIQKADVIVHQVSMGFRKKG